MREYIEVKSAVAPAPTPTGWVKPSDWIDINTVAYNEILLLVTEGTGVGFTVNVADGTGTFLIDWGDGTIETGLVGNGTTVFQHQHTTGGTACSLGYNTWKVRIYGASGNITLWKGAKHTYTNNIQSLPILSINFGTLAITNHSYTFSDENFLWGCFILEKVKCRSFEYCTDTSFMFFNCTALRSVTLPTSFGNVTTTTNMFYSCTALVSVTLPTSLSNLIDASFMFFDCCGLKTIENLQFLGSSSEQTNMVDILRNCESVQQGIVISAMLSTITISGENGKVLKCTSIRLTNKSSLIEGAIPQVNVSYTSPSLEALELLFDDLPTGLTGKNIQITGVNHPIISKGSSSTVMNSTTITIANTSSLATGMEFYGTGISTAKPVTFTDAGDLVNRTAHGLTNGMKISFSLITSTKGIIRNTPY